MRVNIITLCAASALLISTAAIAADTTTPAPAATPAAPVHDKDDDVYCRSEVTSGSIIEKRICHTQREWKQISEQSRHTLNGMTEQRGMPGAH